MPPVSSLPSLGPGGTGKLHPVSKGLHDMLTGQGELQLYFFGFIYIPDATATFPGPCSMCKSTGRGELKARSERRLRWKIDWVILPLLDVTCFFFYGKFPYYYMYEA
jgi:hypothetical protein